MKIQNHEKYFRNKEQIRSYDPDCLWKIVGPFIMIVDDDDSFRLDYQHNREKFYPVDPPEELK